MRRHHRTSEGLPVEPDEVLRSFFAALDGEGIDYARLHDPDDPTTGPGSDVDFVVRPDALRKNERLAAKVAREHGWLITQRRRHELWSVRVTMVDPDSPRAALALDACAHSSRTGCRFLSSDRLLTERVRTTDGTWVAAPAAEFGYLTAKSLTQYLPRYSAAELRRHDVLPGITGWAQVNGRSAAGWEEKFALDLWYVDHHSHRTMYGRTPRPTPRHWRWPERSASRVRATCSSGRRRPAQ